MSGRKSSITQRLIASVLVLEAAAGVTLIAAVAINERRVQSQAFDASLRGTSNGLLSAVQEGLNESIRLDLRGQTPSPDSVFRVTDEHGRVLGAAGEVPPLAFEPQRFQHGTVGGRSYRFFTLAGEKVIDPSEAGGIHHEVTIVYGLPDGRVWHAVVDAIRFFAVCTMLLLGLTTLLLVWLIRRLLSPIHALANAAGEITSTRWQFNPPADASRFAELRPLTFAIEQTVARLQRSFEQQKRFTSDAAHELKTDLAILKSSLQLLTMKTRTVADYERGLAVGLEDLNRLERTVEKMLTLARFEQTEMPREQRCRMDEVLAAAVQKAAALAELRSICMTAEAAEPVMVPLESGDAMLLCSNILLNALQHSPEESSVEIALTVQGSRMRLVVRDHGEGVKDSDALLLFEPFYRGDPSRSRKSGGTGLGLSICKAICERAGGRIAIVRHKDGGAEVSVILPVIAQEHEPAGLQPE